jgi:predicted 3-demethylubiquinone-9 3-methyltransferase (glyoxalase superfamily)
VIYMQKIVPCLWFSNQAEEAAEYYVSVFRDSGIVDVKRFGKGSRAPEGSVMAVSFRIHGYEFAALNTGPDSNFTPAISFFVNCGTREEVDEIWAEFSEGGSPLMELGEYPFSERYGWIRDKYGVTWQLMLAPQAAKIVPSLLFVGAQYRKAEEAMRLYTSQFKDSQVNSIERYDPGQGEAEDAVMYGSFTLAGQEFVAMDSGLEHAFTFTEAISLMVSCEDANQVIMLTENLSSGGLKQPGGWLKDRYGVSWVVTRSHRAEPGTFLA